MELRRIEDWILLIGTILSAIGSIVYEDPKIALIFLICGSIGKALLSIVSKDEKQKIEKNISE